MTTVPCPTCRGRGWSWARAKPLQRGRMVKRDCPICKGRAFVPKPVPEVASRLLTPKILREKRTPDGWLFLTEEWRDDAPHFIVELYDKDRMEVLRGLQSPKAHLAHTFFNEQPGDEK